MEELNDYSGSFVPNANWDSFSRETLLAALKVYGELFVAVDGFWYIAAKEMFDDDTARALDFWVWDKQARYEAKRLRRLFNITGDDVEAFLKITQFGPWSGNVCFQMDLKDKNYGIIRACQCPTLEALIREGQGREQHFCRCVEAPIFEKMARAVNPRMTITPVRLPPQTLGSDVLCEWEVRVAPEG